MTDSYNEQFIAKLEAHYGPWEKETSRFGNAPFGKIARDLSISASQFSKLIYGSATEGMYVRSLRNIDRLIELQRAVNEREEALSKWQHEQRQGQEQKRKAKLKIAVLAAITLAALALASLVLLRSITSKPTLDQHPLSIYFDRDFDADFHSPYLKESEVQDYCPCSAYEGEWSLSQPYKLPLPGNRKPGVYYLAKSADVRMKCFKSDTSTLGRGYVLIAFEYLVNEIWVDTEQTPLSPKYFDKQLMRYTPEFNRLDFSSDPQFRKAATIHSFFIDKFLIYNDSIVRQGEPSGRFASNVDEQLVADYQIDLKHILDNVLGDLTQTNCQAAPNPFCDPNELTEQESVISFDCLYTIKSENLGIGGGYPYTKGYRLEKQSYSDNLTCACQ